MKLPSIAKKSLEEQLLEFDSWITPSLGSIKETERFQTEISDIVEILEVIGKKTNNFSSFSEFDEHSISSHLITTFSDDHLLEHLLKFAKVLFLVTGKSDNNVKCQFPVFLSALENFPGYPVIRRGAIEYKEAPRTIRADSLMGLISKLASEPEIQKDLLSLYVSFILGDEPSKAQFWALGNSYFHLKQYGKELDLLAPIVQFQVRGSVSASGGHIPERILRDQMSEWGLIRDLDFNSNDIIVRDLLTFLGVSSETIVDEVKKTRAYDFVLPYQSKGWLPRIFIQCQFYAGDSGSVSHKNVDQARNSRDHVKKAIENPIFIEYVDGAGYFSSLNGDLKRLLAFPDTSAFIQIRTAAVKLRKAFQDIGFLTPMEMEHAALITEGDKSAIKKLLAQEGYSEEEIERCLNLGIEKRFIQENGALIQVSPDRIALARKYFILDSIVINGSALEPQKLGGSITVPGYSSLYGISISDLGKKLTGYGPAISTLWNNPEILLGDIGWLSERGYVKGH